MSTPDRMPLEGVIVDDEAGVERFCQAIIETTTEFDWAPGMEHSLPEPLREGLRTWARKFVAWDREANR
jgi:hypothetical protein